MGRPQSRAISARGSLRLFDRLNFLSIVITALLGVVIYHYSQPHTSYLSYFLATHRVMNYLGLIHFAVAYQFFFTSPTIRPQLSIRNTTLIAKLLGCVLLSIPFYAPGLSPIVFLFFYIHAFENAGYHIFKLSAIDTQRPKERFPIEALFPLLLVLVLTRLSPSYFMDWSIPMRLARLALLAGTLVFLRHLFPVVSWTEGWTVVRRYPFVIGSFIAVSLFMPEGQALYNLFIIWHYVIWVVYTWVYKPQDRSRLIWSHLMFVALYTPLFLLDNAGMVLFHPLVLTILVGRMSFMAQSVCHFLFSLVFRQYPLTHPQRVTTSLRVAQRSS